MIMKWMEEIKKFSKLPSPGMAIFPRHWLYHHKMWLNIIDWGEDLMLRCWDQEGGREGGRRYITVCYLEIFWSGLVCPDDKLHLITTEICPIIYTIASITADTNIIFQHICNSLLSNSAILGKYHNTTTIFNREYYGFFSSLGNNLG